MSSLRIHSAYRSRVDDNPPAPRLREQIKWNVETMLEPARWEIPSDFLTEAHFRRVVNELEWNSSSGYPYCITETTNRIFFKVKDGKPDEFRMSQVWNLVNNRIAKLLRGEGEVDPIRLFIKPEPIKEKKIAEGRFRLISSVSVIDQIIDHMLFDSFNHKLLDTHPFHPVKVGWSPYGGGWKEMSPLAKVAADKTAWDWTVQAWTLALEFEIRCALCNTGGPVFGTWLQLATMRYRLLFQNPVFVTSGGLLLKQKVPGLMKSGCVNTITTNSIMQVILHVRVSLEIGEDIKPIMVMGDDTLQMIPDNPREYFRRLSKYCILKEVTRGAEFAGFRFNGMHANPMYTAKHAYNLLHVDENFLEEIASSYALLYHRSSEAGWVMRAVAELASHIMGEDQLRLIFDGED